MRFTGGQYGFEVLKKGFTGHCPYFTGGSAVLLEVGVAESGCLVAPFNGYFK